MTTTETNEKIKAEYDRIRRDHPRISQAGALKLACKIVEMNSRPINLLGPTYAQEIAEVKAEGRYPLWH